MLTNIAAFVIGFLVTFSVVSIILGLFIPEDEDEK